MVAAPSRLEPDACGPRPVLEVVADLRARVDRLQGRPTLESLPVHPGLAGLLKPRAGGTYTVASAGLALLMLAGPSAGGAWCGIVGAPELGVEAAIELGVDPARTVVVPDPGPRWLEVTVALVDVLSLVVVRPPEQVGPGQAQRVAARLRSRGSVLVPWGAWPGADAHLSVSEPRWAGVGRGHGHLRSRQVKVAVERGRTPARTRTLWWPAADLSVRPVEPGEDAATPTRPELPDQDALSVTSAARGA